MTLITPKLQLVALFVFCTSLHTNAQTFNQYEIRFPNAVHHEAEITATFSALDDDVLKLRMSRTSPGRYALHEFAKNVYAVSAEDSQGRNLNISRANPHQWNISGHDGTVTFTYKLFANRGDGTYSQIDEIHAHLNVPATFVYAPDLWQRPVSVKIHAREDLNWKVATQLKEMEDGSFFAPHLHYFMDSPIEISNFTLREFRMPSNGKEYNIRLALHDSASDQEADEYMEKIQKVVEQQMAIYGELPEFDFGTYTFLACYHPTVSGDGMEHRNSTVLTSTRSLSQGGLNSNIGTVSHEFFHAWNVERIRPMSLEPFDYEEANMSGELWFAEGFTSYYTNLILCRAGLITQDRYISGLVNTMNYVWNSSARAFFNPIEMSYQAPFVDAATSIDPVDRNNTFISYYAYGNVLGLALDLSLRSLDKGLDLDGYMKLVWDKFGRTEIPYTVRDLQIALEDYAGDKFGKEFFDQYIFQSQEPDHRKLFSQMGIEFDQPFMKNAYLSASALIKDGKAEISSHPKRNQAAYRAGLRLGDQILSIGDRQISEFDNFSDLINNFRAGETVQIVFERDGMQRTTQLQFDSDPNYTISLIPDENASASVLENRRSWLGPK